MKIAFTSQSIPRVPAENSPTRGTGDITPGCRTSSLAVVPSIRYNRPVPRTPAVISLVVILVSTVPASCTRPTHAVVAKFEHGGSGLLFRHCRITLGWTAEEFVERCGEPIASIASAVEEDERCFAYKSWAHALGTSDTVAPYFIVCLQPFGSGKRRGTTMVRLEGIPDESIHRYRVSGVFGLQDLPDRLKPLTLTSTTP